MERAERDWPSPLYDSVLYFMKGNTGGLSAFDAKTGKPHYQMRRIEGVPNVFASPVGADGKVHVLGQDVWMVSSFSDVCGFRL